MTRYSDDFKEEVRSRISISDVVGTKVTWDKRKTNVQRGDFWGCCPFHGESRPSFHCEDRKGRYHCFGCGADGDHFEFFMELDRVEFPRALEIVAGLAGIRMPDAKPETEEEKKRREAAAAKRRRDAEERERQREADDAGRRDFARWLWSKAIPIIGTPAEAYLNRRMFDLSDFPDGEGWPPTFRFHPSLIVPSDPDIPVELHRKKVPGLVCAVQAVDRSIVAIWRHFLDADGRALLNVDGGKIKLGLGLTQGGAVRLGPVTETLRLTEGTETGVAVKLMTNPEASTWATLSTAGMRGFVIPPGVKRLEIYADGDRHRLHKTKQKVVEPPGIDAANALVATAEAQGVEGVIYPSPAPDDWQDVWETRKKNDRTYF